MANFPLEIEKMVKGPFVRRGLYLFVITSSVPLSTAIAHHEVGESVYVHFVYVRFLYTNGNMHRSPSRVVHSVGIRLDISNLNNTFEKVRNSTAIAMCKNINSGYVIYSQQAYFSKLY